MERTFRYVEKDERQKISQRIRSRLPKHETVDQLEKVFVFGFETCNDQEFTESYAAGIYNVNGLRDSWDRDLCPNETNTEKENVTIVDGSHANPVLHMRKYILENCKGYERTYIDQDGDEIVSSYRLYWLRIMLVVFIVGLY